MASEPEVDLNSHPAVRGYSLVCLVALLTLTILVTERGLGWWGMMPVLLGAAALLFRWSVGPPLVLVTLAVLLSAQARFRAPRWAQVGPSPARSTESHRLLFAIKASPGDSFSV